MAMIWSFPRESHEQKNLLIWTYSNIWFLFYFTHVIWDNCSIRPMLLIFIIFYRDAWVWEMTLWRVLFTAKYMSSLYNTWWPFMYILVHIYMNIFDYNLPHTLPLLLSFRVFFFNFTCIYTYIYMHIYTCTDIHIPTCIWS